MSVAPCKDCTDRKLLCHGSCKRYQEYRAKVEAAQRERQKESDASRPLPKEIRYKLNKISRGKRGG